MIRVLGRVTSIYVRKVLWYLEELGTACEREDRVCPAVLAPAVSLRAVPAQMVRDAG